MIEAAGLSKRYGPTLAVDDLSFTVPPGQVTGFLGPNGAGKSTTMRLILGLDAPSSGSVTVSGRPYAALQRPQPPAVPGPQQRDQPGPGRAGAGPGRAAQRRPQARGRLLARHGTAPGYRRRAARRPAGAD